MSVCDDRLIIGFLFPIKEYQVRFLIAISYKSIVSEVVVEPIVPVKIASKSLSVCTYIHRTDNICFAFPPVRIPHSEGYRFQIRFQKSLRQY